MRRGEVFFKRVKGVKRLDGSTSILMRMDTANRRNRNVAAEMMGRTLEVTDNRSGRLPSASTPDVSVKHRTIETVKRLERPQFISSKCRNTIACMAGC